MTVEIALKARAEGEKRAQEEADRKRNHEWAMQRIREDNEKRAKAYAKFAEEVKQAGGCMRCSDSYRHKIRRHRKPCPYA